jgi:hypothetical protein
MSIPQKARRLRHKKSVRCIIFNLSLPPGLCHRIGCKRCNCRDGHIPLTNGCGTPGFIVESNHGNDRCCEEHDKCYHTWYAVACLMMPHLLPTELPLAHFQQGRRRRTHRNEHLRRTLQEMPPGAWRSGGCRPKHHTLGHTPPYTGVVRRAPALKPTL